MKRNIEMLMYRAVEREPDKRDYFSRTYRFVDTFMSKNYTDYMEPTGSNNHLVYKQMLGAVIDTVMSDGTESVKRTRLAKIMRIIQKNNSSQPCLYQ